MKVNSLCLLLLGTFPVMTLSAAAPVVSPEMIEQLQKQIQALQQEVERLKEQHPAGVAPKADYDLMREQPGRAKGLSIGIYGEAKYRFPEEGSAVFDPHRFVLTPSYEIADWLIFNSELEFEHGGIDENTGATRSRFNGEIEVEQFYVDVLIDPRFNIRSLGIDLVPVGRINRQHEPTVFYSTERPELYREIIPSTWFEPSIGFFGKIAEGWNYHVMVSTGLEDAISGTPTPGIAAAGGVRNARPRLRQADESDLAYTGRIQYNGLRGLDTSTSLYWTRVKGTTGRSAVALWDIEALYRVPRTALELRAEFAYWWIDRPEHLVANNNASLTDDVGDRMYGWYVEAAYHFWPDAWKEGKGGEMDLVPFIRYTDIVTQSGLSGGSTRVDNGTTNKDFLTVGLSYFLNANFVVKADYRRNLNGSGASAVDSANQDYFQLGAGVFF